MLPTSTLSRFVVCAALAAAAGVAWWSLADRDAAPAAATGATRVAVVVAPVQLQDVPVSLASQGHVVPLNEVEIRSQVTAIVRTIHFHEGDDVAAGQLLFTLDSADADAQLHRAIAQEAQVEAQLAQAQREQRRAEELRGTGYLSTSAMDTIASNVVALEAQRTAARADVAGARTRVGQTRLVAPMAGKAGAVAVHPGSLAQPGDATPLVRLVQLDPVAVEFTLPERHVAALLAARAAGTVRVLVDAGADDAPTGELVFIDNSITAGTGTIALKARMPNAAQTLWPGAFVRVLVDAGLDRGVALLPPQAVLDGDDGRRVYVIDDGGVVSERRVTLLRMQDRFAVVSGLDGGERVIVEGLQDVQPGGLVDTRDAVTLPLVARATP